MLAYEDDAMEVREGKEQAKDTGSGERKVEQSCCLRNTLLLKLSALGVLESNILHL
jgi:hypothetical protein